MPLDAAPNAGSRLPVTSLGNGWCAMSCAARSPATPAPAPSASSPANTGTAERLGASATGVFQHPGLLVTEPDFARIRSHIQSGQSPWVDWWNKLCTDRAVSLTEKPSPLGAVYRADGSKHVMYRDIQRAWCLALRWKLSGDV